MEKCKLDNEITLINSNTCDAVSKFKSSSVRFLFLDGDHSEEGVRQDLNLFFPKLALGAIIVFDDFSKNFPGVVRVVDEYFEKKLFKSRCYYRNTLVVKI